MQKAQVGSQSATPRRAMIRFVARDITKALEDGVAAGRCIAERSDSTGSYSERIAARFRIYAETRAHLYEIERRDGPFWQKRRERSRAMVARE